MVEINPFDFLTIKGEFEARRRRLTRVVYQVLELTLRVAQELQRPDIAANIAKYTFAYCQNVISLLPNLVGEDRAKLNKLKEDLGDLSGEWLFTEDLEDYSDI